MLRPAFALLAALALSACETVPASPAQVWGVVIWRAPGELSPPGVVTVTLADVTPADPRSGVVRRQVIETVTTSPVAYTLGYDPRRIDPTRSYAVSAKVEVEGRVVLATAAQPVITGGAPDRVDLIAVRAP